MPLRIPDSGMSAGNPDLKSYVYVFFVPLDEFAAYFLLLKQHLLPFPEGKEEHLWTAKNAILARFGVHLGGFWL